MLDLKTANKPNVYTYVQTYRYTCIYDGRPPPIVGESERVSNKIDNGLDDLIPPCPCHSSYTNSSSQVIHKTSTHEN